MNKPQTALTFAALVPVLPQVALVAAGAAFVVWLLADEDPPAPPPEAAEPAGELEAEPEPIPWPRRPRLPRRRAVSLPPALADAVTAATAPSLGGFVPPARGCPVPRSAPPPRAGVTAEDVRACLAAGPLARPALVAALRARTGCGHSAAYKALAPGGRCSDLVTEGDDGRLALAR